MRLVTCVCVCVCGGGQSTAESIQMLLLFWKRFSSSAERVASAKQTPRLLRASVSALQLVKCNRPYHLTLYIIKHINGFYHIHIVAEYRRNVKLSSSFARSRPSRA